MLPLLVLVLHMEDEVESIESTDWRPCIQADDVDAEVSLLVDMASLETDAAALFTLGRCRFSRARRYRMDPV